MAEQFPISDLLLERHVLGELSAAEQRELLRRLEANPDAQARLAAIRRSNQEVLSAYPPEIVVPQIKRRVEQANAQSQAAAALPRWRFFWGSASATLAVAALAVLVLRPASFAPSRPAAPETTRAKGLRPRLLIFAKPTSEKPAAPLFEGAVVRVHALLQIAYVAAGFPYGVVLSIDGRGAATLHHPARPSQTTRLQAGQVLLPSAYELDDAPLFERFFFVTAATPIDVAAVLAAARQLAADPQKARTAALVLPVGLEQTSVLLRKDLSAEPAR